MYKENICYYEFWKCRWLIWCKLPLLLFCVLWDEVGATGTGSSISISSASEVNLQLGAPQLQKCCIDQYIGTEKCVTLEEAKNVGILPISSSTAPWTSLLIVGDGSGLSGFFIKIPSRWLKFDLDISLRSILWFVFPTLNPLTRVPIMFGPLPCSNIDKNSATAKYRPQGNIFINQTCFFFWVENLMAASAAAASTSSWRNGKDSGILENALLNQ